mmetsp:Transcript_25438/g.58588  ORF Transcript_25438/g.58588 Transcript_25438/m.58588 type:complete len:532 (-) Transcript_25438:95-1690(-)
MGGRSGGLEAILQEIASTPNQFQAHAQAGLRFAARRPDLRKKLAEAEAASRRARIHRAVEVARARAELEEQQRNLPTARSDVTATTDTGSTSYISESGKSDFGSRADTVETISSDDEIINNPSRTAFERGITFDGGSFRLQEPDDLQPATVAGLDPAGGASSIPPIPIDLARRATCVGHLSSSRSKDCLDHWPLDVQEALDANDIKLTAHRTLPAVEFTDAQRVLRLVGAGCSIPHPEKGGGNNGADSFYIDATSSSMGVADGVGEWEWRFKCSARAFADELMEGCKQAARRVEAPMARKMGSTVVEMLGYGHESTRSFGAATALVARLGGDDNSTMGVACLGDAALLHLRPEKVGQQRTSYRRLTRTKEQQHTFNCPFQLARLPVKEDFPQLLREGKEALVSAVEKSKKGKQDQPEDAEWYVFQVQRGDLLILGTDGLFDNLYDQDISELADHAVSPFEVDGLAQADGEVQCRYETELSSRLASALSKAAFSRSMSRAGKTPFADHARQVGMYHTGGKMDDITCVCAWIV